MKKILPLLMLFTGMVNAQIVNIPDANFKAQLLSASPTVEMAQDFSDQWMTIDANGDGEIQVSEAQAVKFLAVSHSAITDITGLNSFSNLQNLRLILNQVTSLDLNALTNLRTLACYNIPALTSISINNLINLTEINFISLYNLTTLNVSSLTNLTKLNVLYCGLTTLNVNGLTNLTELNCAGNQLTNLNGVPNVTKLNCSYNLLTALNLNGLTNLTELNCSGNELTTLNVNALTTLTKLECEFTKISTLNISGLPNLTTLLCSNNKDLTNVTLVNLPALQDLNVVGILNQSGEVISNLTSLNLSGLPNVQKIVCAYGKLTSLDLSNLTSLKELYFSSNLLTSLNLTNLPNLEKLDCSRNRISTLDVTGLTNLVELSCGSAYIQNGQNVPPFLTSLNVAGLANLKILNCSGNALTSLDLTGLPNLEILYCGGIISNGNITSLNINHLSNLKKLNCSYQTLTSLDASNLINLTDLSCDHNFISTLNLNGLVNLKTLDYTYNQLATLSLVNLPSLESLFCGNNQLVTLNVLDLANLKTLWCADNQLTTLNLSGLSSLISLDISRNDLSLADISGLSTNLLFLACMSNNLTSLDVSGLTNLEALHCQFNNLTSLDVSTLTNLRYLTCFYNELTNLNLGGLQNLETLDCSNNQLPSVDISGVGSSLSGFNCSHNQLTSLDLSNHYNLTGLGYSYNVLPNLDLSQMTNLKNLDLKSTQTTVLDVSNMPNLEALECSNNQITTLDVSHAPNLQSLYCEMTELQTIDVSNAHGLQQLFCAANIQLTSIFMKNGSNEFNIGLYSVPNLQYVCADDSQLEQIQSMLNSEALTATACNSYCSFTPGGNHNRITGITIFDDNNDGCDVTDEVNPFIRLNINDTSVDGATVTNINGTYNFYTNAGNYVISPNTENPTWFDFSPASANFSFLDNNNNISTQNFCITAVGVHKDIEVVFTQLEPARPGFDTDYKVVYKNKGNQMQSGTVTLNFDDTRTDLVVSTPAVDVTGTDLLSWNFTNLMPFENRSILLTLNINSPMEVPAVNNGDILNFTASVTPIAGDELPNDNQFTFNQTVLGSFDPNNIICLEGETLSPTEIGNYLHYIVNFENTGTFYAENVVVRLEIDESKFDMNSLQLLNSSNPSTTRISGNTVEFVLEDINLAAVSGNPPVGGHGDVLFKIRTKEDLQTNDTVLQRAGIYFDYNFPVITNDAETTFAVLSNPIFEIDDSITIYPNPTASILNIDSDFTIESMELYDVQGRILETVLVSEKITKLDISSKSKGIYFLKIKSEKGSKVEKVVKE